MFSLPPMQVANQEVAVMTHGKIKVKFFRFSLWGTVRQDQVGVIDRTRIKLPMFMFWQFTQDGNV